MERHSVLGTESLEAFAKPPLLAVAKLTDHHKQMVAVRGGERVHRRRQRLRAERVEVVEGLVGKDRRARDRQLLKLDLDVAR